MKVLVTLPMAHFTGAGTYYPAVTNSQGNNIPAKWVGNFAADEGAYVNDAGTRIERDPSYFQLTVFNSRNSQPGNGLADNAAKFMSKGKAMTCHAQMKSFNKKAYSENTPVMLANGSQFEYQAINFTHTSDFNPWGRDAESQIKREIQAYVDSATKGTAEFGIRSPDWDNQGTDGYVEFQTARAYRKALVWDGSSKTYGFATVRIPEGATLDQKHINKHSAPAPTNEKKYEWTAEELRASGWTNEQINDKYPGLIVPQPPESNSPPVPPAATGAGA